MFFVDTYWNWSAISNHKIIFVFFIEFQNFQEISEFSREIIFLPIKEVGYAFFRFKWTQIRVLNYQSNLTEISWSWKIVLIRIENHEIFITKFSVNELFFCSRERLINAFRYINSSHFREKVQEFIHMIILFGKTQFDHDKFA